MPTREFGVWMPDQASIGPPHLRTAKGCLPGVDHYHPLKSLVVTTGALDDRCRGAFPVRDIDNAAHMYAGDASKLYELESAGWTDRSRVGGYSANTNTRWRGTTFGDRFILTNGIDELQYIDMSTAATAFADLTGITETALYIATYLEFVFLGALGSSRMAIKWSALGDSEGWTPGVGQSDEQEFADGGNITGLSATKAAVYVFQEKCIRRVQYVGGDAIMQIDKLVENIGCIEPNSLIQYGQRCFFLGEDGWYMWDFESQPVPIGLEKFDKWFLDQSDRAYWYAMSAAIDPKNRVMAVAFSTGGSDTLDTKLFYNYELGKATYDDSEAVEILVPAISTFTSIDDLTGDVDTDYSISFDDPYWQGGAFYFAAFNALHRLASFSGDNVEATFELNEAMMFDGRRTSIVWAKPLVDASGATVAAGSKVKPSDAVTFQSQVSQQDSGRCPQRGANGFYHAAKVVVPAGETWTFARGVEFEPSSVRSVR